jgi:hypothetical protein
MYGIYINSPPLVGFLVVDDKSQPTCSMGTESRGMGNMIEQISVYNISAMRVGWGGGIPFLSDSFFSHRILEACVSSKVYFPGEWFSKK